MHIKRSEYEAVTNAFVHEHISMDSISSHFFEIGNELDISHLLFQSEPDLALVEQPLATRAPIEADSFYEIASYLEDCYSGHEPEDHPLPVQCRKWLDSIIMDVRSSLHESSMTVSSATLWPADGTTSISTMPKMVPIPETIAHEDACWRSTLATRSRRGTQHQDAMVHRATTFSEFLKYLLHRDTDAICWKDQDVKVFKV